MQRSVEGWYSFLISIWKIEKMVEFGLIDFSDRLIYEDSFNLNISLLSVFLFEVYFWDFDLFIFNLSFQFASVKNVDYLFSTYNSIWISDFRLPIYLEKRLGNVRHLGEFTQRHLSLKNELLSAPSSFIRRFFYTRYKDHFLFGFSGSRNFSLFLADKICSFFRTNLNMNISSSALLKYNDQSLYFLSYRIIYKESLFNYGQYKFDIYTPYKFNFSLVMRINIFRRKFTRIFLKRVNNELNIFLKRLILTKGTVYTNFKDKKFWMSLFQFEAVRAVQFWVLFNDQGKSYLFPQSQFFYFKFFDLSLYNNYSFDLYIYKSRLILGALLESFQFSIFNSILPVDLLTSFYLVELKKRMLFSYVNYSSHLISGTSHESSIIFDKIYLGSFPFSNSLDSISMVSSVNLRLFAPISYIYYKLRHYGFVHQIKMRPIANSKYLFLSDISIIRSFGFFAYSFIFWYLYSENYLKIKHVIEFLRQSCMLTLCRKHNKSKAWAYRVFTSDLVLVKGLFNSYSFFPSQSFLFSLSRGVKSSGQFFCLNEVLFLSFNF